MKTALKTLVVLFTLTLSVSGTALAGPTHVEGTNALSVEFKSGNIVSPGNAILATINAPKRGKGTLIITDNAGRVVSKRYIQLLAGRNLVNFRMSELPEGLYFMQVQVGNSAETRTFYVN